MLGCVSWCSARSICLLGEIIVWCFNFGFHTSSVCLRASRVRVNFMNLHSLISEAQPSQWQYNYVFCNCLRDDNMWLRLSLVNLEHRRCISFPNLLRLFALANDARLAYQRLSLQILCAFCDWCQDHRCRKNTFSTLDSEYVRAWMSTIYRMSFRDQFNRQISYNTFGGL